KTSMSAPKPAVAGRAALLGLCAAFVAIIGAHWSHETQARTGLALFLALTACVYPGATLAQATTRTTTAVEIVICGLVFTCAWLGISLHVSWLAVGYGLHGTWDWLHHFGHMGARVARWFPPACAVFDFVLAGYVLLAV